MLFSPITVPFRLASAFLHSFHISIKLLMQFPHFIWCLHSMLIHKFISKTAIDVYPLLSGMVYEHASISLKTA